LEALYKAARDQTLVDELSSSSEATAAPSLSAEDQPLQITRSFGPRSEDAKGFAGCRTRGAFDIAALVRSTAKRLLSDVGYKDTLSSYAVRGGQISELTSHPHDLAFSFSKFAANCHLCSMQAGQILQLKHCHMART
jgi:hypothetical protein